MRISFLLLFGAAALVVAFLPSVDASSIVDNEAAKNDACHVVQDVHDDRQLNNLNDNDGNDNDGNDNDEYEDDDYDDEEDDDDSDDSDVDDDDDSDDDDEAVYAEYVHDTILPPNQVQHFQWKSDNSIMDPYAARIGLSPKLVATIDKFAQDLSLYSLIHDILYQAPCNSDGGRFYQQVLGDNNATNANTTTTLLWSVQRPGDYFQSDMHWLSAGDELTHEYSIRMLWKGGFYSILQAIGDYFQLESLAIQGVGFLAVTYANQGGIHYDFKDVQGKAFNVLIPLVLPQNNTDPEFKIMDKNEVYAAIKFHSSEAVLVGDTTWHGTRDCDFTLTQEMRVMLSIYIADLQEDNVEIISEDRTAIFPVPGVVDWLWAQRGRHWRKDGTTDGVDLGRRPFRAKDRLSECREMAERGDCKSGSDPFWTRKMCPTSCHVYVDHDDYQPGVDRSIVIGDLPLKEQDQSEEETNVD